MAEFNDKFVAFIDILGFKELVERAERGSSPSLDEIRGFLAELADLRTKDWIRAHGPKTCPCAPFVQRDLDFEVTQVSDCAILSAEISPAGLINLVSQCWGAVIMLLTKGVLVRGYVTRGRIYHSGSDFYGSGYHDALARERTVSAFKQEADEQGTPFVQVDQAVVEYATNCADNCVREMFDRMVAHDGDVWALYPFKRLSHSFIIAGFGVTFDPDKERNNNDNLRKSINRMKERVSQLVDPTNEAALRKTRHYIRALDKQLEACDRTDDAIEMWRSKPL